VVIATVMEDRSASWNDHED